jgi:hypothetical protein
MSSGHFGDPGVDISGDFGIQGDATLLVVPTTLLPGSNSLP